MQWEDLLDEAKADAQMQARIRERWLRRQAAESATLVGTLLDLAESGVGVSISSMGGRRHDGTIVGLGTDVVVLADRGEHVAVRLSAVTLVRPHPGSATGLASGDRPAALDLGFIELLARVVDDEPEVAIAFVIGETAAGTLLAVGIDIVSLRVAPGVDGIVYCSATTISSVRFGSG